MTNKLYALSYEGKLHKSKNNKHLYFDTESAEKAMSSVSRRLARKKIDSWKIYSKEECQKLVEIERNKLNILAYEEICIKVKSETDISYFSMIDDLW